MLCDEFDTRLQKLLDHRRSPDADRLLQRHARVCLRCREQLTATARLLAGLELLEVPPLRDDFALRVVQEVMPASQTQRARWSPLALAVAATLLIALLPSVGYLLRSSGLRAPNTPARTSGAGEVALATSPTSTDQSPVVQNSPWLRYGNSILELYPEKTRARHRQQVSALAKDLRPIATPFNTAVMAIRRTIPVGRSSEKGQPSASTAPHATRVTTHV